MGLRAMRAEAPRGRATTRQYAEEVAKRTSKLLGEKGWCLWKCRTLGGEGIVVVGGENDAKVPGGYPVYTEAELEELCGDDVSEATIRLVHEAKRIAGAEVQSVQQERLLGR